MNTLQDMPIFVRVAEPGGFTAAAASLDSSRGSTSRAISELELRLRTRLLHRSTRRIALTEPGLSYLERCRYILGDIIDQAEEEVSCAPARREDVG